MSKISYVILVQKLISCQFIDQGQLPNANGEFVLPPLYSSTTSADCTATNSYAPALNHCKISRDQLIKLGLESQIATEGGDTQVYESQNGTERDFIVTQTEVDQSFDFDMELRTPSQGEENSYPTSTKCGKTYQPTSTFRSPPIVPSFTSLLATINQSIDQNGLTTQLNFDSSLEMTKEDDQDGYSLSQRNFFTQNMTQESLLEMEKWLLTSSQTDNPARNLPPNPQELQSQVKQEGEEYDVSSDEEPPLINHYPLSANPKFVHSEAPQQDVTVPKENPNALNSLTISEPSPDDESQTQPQILYTETDGTQSAVLREYTSVYIPDTLTSSWDTPPDIPAAMPQVSSSPSHDGFIGKKFHKTFPGVGTYCGCVSEYNR